MEQCIASDMCNHLNYNKIITLKHHGFRKDMSCEQWIQAMNDLMSALNEDAQIDMNLLDFSLAFDVVPHQHLLSKLNMYGNFW